jgi:hypothetical protein
MKPGHEWSVEHQRRASASVDTEFASNSVQFGIDDRNLAWTIKGHDQACASMNAITQSSAKWCGRNNGNR